MQKGRKRKLSESFFDVFKIKNKKNYMQKLRILVRFFMY